MLNAFTYHVQPFLSAGYATGGPVTGGRAEAGARRVGCGEGARVSGLPGERRTTSVPVRPRPPALFRLSAEDISVSRVSGALGAGSMSAC